MSNLIDNNGVLETPPNPKYEPDPRGLGVHCFDKMREFSDKISQIKLKTNESATYGEILTKSIRVALKMKSLGITEEHFVSLCTGTHSETCLPFWAAIFMGAKLANLHTLLTLDEMKYLSNLTKPKIIFSASECVEKLEIVVKDLNLDTIIVVFGETKKHIPFKEFIEAQDGEEDFLPKTVDDLSETVAVLFSSGTTGLPKGICLTHYCILSAMNMTGDYFQFQPVLCFSTPYWIGYFTTIATCLKGGANIIFGKFDETTILKTIQDYKVACVLLMPSFTYAITKHLDKNKEQYDTSSLKAIFVGGGKLGAQQRKKLEKLFKNCFVINGYGSTEVTGLCTIFSDKYDPELLLTKLDSCGKLIPGSICKVVDIDTKEILGPNKPGELLIKSQLLMKGYYNDPKETAKVFDEDGFLRTGDVVYYDEDYCFYVVDRIKEMFKYKFWHIVPAELEQILLKHPAVNEVIVIGVPHEINGDHPMAIIVPNDTVKVSEDDILKFFNDQVSSYKNLRGGVKFVKSLPKTAIGKYNRRALRNMVINNEI